MQSHGIPSTTRKVKIHHDWGDTDDIMAVIMAVVDKDDLKAQVATFAEQFRGATPEQQRQGLERLWQTCRANIRYQEDPGGLQAIKHPARTWADKVADCKSLTVFIYHCCRAIDVPCFVRFASYDKNKQIGHVYPVAVVDGEAIPVDAVWMEFGTEKRPTHFENHLPAVFAKDAGMVQAVKTSHPQVSAIGSITTGWQQLKSWQKAVALALGGWLAYKIAT